VRTVLAIAFAAAVVAAVPAAAEPTIPVLWSVAADGTARTAVTTLPADGRILDRTAAGRLAVQTGDGLALEDAGGGNRVLLPGTRYAYGASFSPDGSSVLFALPAADGGWSADPRSATLEIAAADASSVRVVATDAAAGSWSRDGRLIVYPGDVAAHSATVFAVPAAGGTPRRLAAGAYVGAYDDAPPQLSPRGGAVAYECANRGGGTLCVTRAGRTRRYAHAGWAPLWSPNGRYVATWVAGNYNSGAAVVDTVKGLTTVLAKPANVAVDYRPLAWSPDSTRLLYERTCAGGTFVPGTCRAVTWVRTLATRRDRRVSVDGLSWQLARWRGRTITYVTG
jgi:Tol biopolymer transport system component